MALFLHVPACSPFSSCLLKHVPVLLVVWHSPSNVRANNFGPRSETTALLSVLRPWVSRPSCYRSSCLRCVVHACDLVGSIHIATERRWHHDGAFLCFAESIIPAQRHMSRVYCEHPGNNGILNNRVTPPQSTIFEEHNTIPNTNHICFARFPPPLKTRACIS